MATPFCHSSVAFLNYCHHSAADIYAGPALRLQHYIGPSNLRTALDQLKWVLRLRQCHLGCKTKSVFLSVSQYYWTKIYFMNRNLLRAYNASAKKALVFYFLTSEKRKKRVLALELQWHLKMSNNFSRPWIRSTEHEKDGLNYVTSHINLEQYDIFCPFSGWRLVLLVILVKVLSNLWRRPLHENPLLYKPSTSLWRRHLPGTAHRGSTLQHTALSRYGQSSPCSSVVCMPQNKAFTVR